MEFCLQLCLLGWGKWYRIRLEIEWRKEINMIEDRLSGFYPRFFHDLIRSFPPAHLFPYIVWFLFLYSFRGLMILEDCNCLSDPIWECNVAPRSLQTSWGIEVILVNHVRLQLQAGKNSSEIPHVYVGMTVGTSWNIYLAIASWTK